MAWKINFSPGAKISWRFVQKYPCNKKKVRKKGVQTRFSQKGPSILNFGNKLLNPHIKLVLSIYLKVPFCALCLVFDEWRNYDFLCEGWLDFSFYHQHFSHCAVFYCWQNEKLITWYLVIINFLDRTGRVLEKKFGTGRVPGSRQGLIFGKWFDKMEQRGRIKTLILKFIGWHRLFETYHSPRKRSTQIARSTTESKVTFIFTRYLNKLLFTTESQVTFIFTRYLNKWFHCSDYLSKRLQVWSGDESTYRMLHCNVKTEVHVLQYSMI